MHPLDPLVSSEISAAASLIRSYETDKDVHFKNIELIEPPKKLLRKFLRDERIGSKITDALSRRVSLLYYHRRTANLFRAVVNLSAKEIEDVRALDSRFHGQADMDEVVEVRDRCLSHPQVLERIKQYGLSDNFTVVCDTWPYGRDSGEKIRRLSQCFLYAQDKKHPGSNSYDNPLPFSPVIDYITKELVEIIELPVGEDHSTRETPELKYVPHEAKEWHHDLQKQPKRMDLKPLYVHQPQGPSFGIDGHLITWLVHPSIQQTLAWSQKAKYDILDFGDTDHAIVLLYRQKWRFRLGFNWREGMILHDVTYDGRELFHRLSLSEMFVPYGDPRTPYSRKSVFDVGDIGAGVAANNLALGCDCLGLIKYFSFVISDSKGQPIRKDNAVCMHEIDDGIGWKHSNNSTGQVSIVRSRVLVLQTIITVGNYEYIFMWHFDQAAALHYRIQATGILSTVPIAPGATVPFGTNVNENVMAPYHQHVFSLRIDPALDGDKTNDRNSFLEEDSVAMPFDENNPVGVGYITKKNVVTKSGFSKAQPNRTHKIINPSVINKVSQRPVAYAIHSAQKEMLLAHPDSWHAKRAKYALEPFWVTKHSDTELYAAGDYTYQSLPAAVDAGSSTDSGAGGDLGTWAARGDNVDDEDIVVWHSISLTHNPRPEDYPVMPVESMTVSLKPSGFFESNPALDVPQSSQRNNRSVLYEHFQATQQDAGKGCCEGKTSKI